MSVVIKGKTDKSGVVKGNVPNSSGIYRNEWDFKLVSLSITPAIDLKCILEVGCSFHTSSCFNYRLNKFLDKNSPLCVKYFDISASETKTYEFSESVFPWIRIEQPGDRLDISFFEPGTDSPLPADCLEVTCHLAVRRIK